MPRDDAKELFVPDGTPLDEARSGLQKSIRRGDDLGSAYWALQLAAKFPWLLFRRLAVIACEDVGLANPAALTVVVAARTAYEHAVKESRAPRPESVLVVWPTLYLARSPKNREADDLANSVQHLMERGWRAQVPDYALDLHTMAGRAAIPKGQQLGHWLEVASHLENESGSVDWRLWIRRWAARRGHLDAEQVEAQARQWKSQRRLVHGLDGYGSLPQSEDLP